MNKKAVSNNHSYFQHNLLDQIANIEAEKVFSSSSQNKNTKTSLMKPVKPISDTHTDNERASLIESISDTHTDNEKASLIESHKPGISRFLARAAKKEKTPIACVNEYCPGGRSKKYYRVSYFINGRTKHIHIPGGNVNSDLAKARKEQLEKAISNGAAVEDLIAAINIYRGKK